MSHSTRVGDYTFIHNGDYSWDVQIVNNLPERGEVSEFTLPCVTLLRFTAEMIRQQRISNLEDTPWEELLK
jgi:hypothetical protein